MCKYNIATCNNISQAEQKKEKITCSIRVKRCWKTRGVKPCWSLDKLSSNRALAGPHIVYVFPLPV